MEKQFRNKKGNAYVHLGYESRSAVGSGAQRPTDTIPLQEGTRLLFAKAVDKWWKIICVGLFARKVVRAPFKKRRKRRG